MIEGLERIIRKKNTVPLEVDPLFAKLESVGWNVFIEADEGEPRIVIAQWQKHADYDVIFSAEIEQKAVDRRSGRVWSRPEWCCSSVGVRKRREREVREQTGFGHGTKTSVEKCIIAVSDWLAANNFESHTQGKRPA
jgi:hypothetical protein